MAEYLSNAVQSIALNSPAIFTASIPCRKGYIYHEDETGIFTLRGIVNNPSSCFARYQVTFNGNIAIPEGGAVTPISMALAISGEPRATSTAIYTPAAADEYGNITCTCIVTVPRGCCFNLSVEYIDATAEDPTTTPTPTINLKNANLVISRIA